METDDPQVYEKVSAIAHPVFLVITLLTQSTLIFFAIFYSPKHIKALRFLLMKTSFLQVLVSLILFYVQPRLLAGTSVNVPVYCYGWCMRNNNMFCFALYMFWQTFSLGVAISLTFTLYFKYHKLTSNVPFTRCRLVASLLLAYIPFYISMACAIVITLRSSLPEVAKRQENVGPEMDNPDIPAQKYTVIGRMTLGALPNRINFFMLGCGIYVAPIIALWFRWKSHKAMNEKIVGASTVLKFHAKTVMKGLTIQVISHFVFYIPMFSLYIYCILTNTQVYVQQFFLALSPNLTAAVDPLINLYYVVPYRNRILQLLGRGPRISPIRVLSVSTPR